MNPLIIDDKPLTLKIREARKSLRATVYTVIVLFMNALIAPDVFAIQDGVQKAEQRKEIVLTGSPENKLNQALVKLQEEADHASETIADRIASESGFMDSVLSFLGMSRIQLEEIDRFKTLEKLIKEQHKQALTGFQETENQLKKAKLSDQIMKRHHEALAQYESTYSDMMARLEKVTAAGSLRDQGEAVDALNDLMTNQKLKKTHQSVDPNNLPWGTPDAAKARKPAETAEELSQVTGIPNYPQPTMVAANVITPDMLGKPGGPVAEDLAETIDVQLTEAIRAKASELEEDPVQIYNWVRNNIEFIPSYGSIQGADYTLQAGKGNAFDTASLLIALLRAANIPARYAYGTVEIPVEKAMNWVGGVDVSEAAQQLLGQGGIPNVAMVSGGKVSHIRMEHVWVEGWVDYFPSRAAKHSVGDGWIPLDGSFKQYEFTEGQSLSDSVPFNEEALVATIESSATVNETEGWVQGINQTDVKTAIAEYQQQIVGYIRNQNPDATVADVLGIQKIIVQDFQQLSAGLPYKLIARTHNYSQLPSGLRHKFRYTLGTQFSGVEDVRLITFEKFLPELAGKKLAVSFRPATEADENVINSYLPEPHPETGEMDSSQFPMSLPGYLINLTAEFTEDGIVAKSGEAGTMGGELYETMSLWSPSQHWQQAVNHPVAGEYRAIGLSLQGASAEQAQNLQTEIEATTVALEGADEARIDALTRHEVVGDLLYATILSYLALNDVQDQVQSRAAGVVEFRLPSYGVFGSSLQADYWFGLPRTVSFAGLVMDVDHLAMQVAAKDNEKEKRISFIRAVGARSSAAEHLVPEQMFSTVEEPAQGISAVKALALASSEGQKIWTIDRANLDIALAAINLGSEIETEIRNAVRAGKVATTHESPVGFAGGANVGYLVIDPATGAGAYKIAGGMNGGLIALSWGSALLLFLTGVGAIAVGPLVFALLIAVNILSNLILYWSNANCSPGGLEFIAYVLIIMLPFLGGRGLEAIRMFLFAFLGVEGAAAGTNKICGP